VLKLKIYKKIEQFINKKNNLQKEIKLIKYCIKEPEFGTIWYWVLTSNTYFRFKVFIYLLGVIFILFIFNICRYVKKYLSLVVFIYIAWFCFSIFYIEFIRV
jgi:membrane protein YdbS with pleckstrin-like domain